MFLAIDPGIKTGWCVLDAGGVVAACGKGEEFPTLSSRAAVIERPQVYRAGKSKGDPNDLITLAIRVGRYVERLERCGVRTELVLPTTWKGQVPKRIHHDRVAALLTTAERDTIFRVAKRPGDSGYSEDVWDAVALAKWACQAGRFAIAHVAR